MTRISTATIFSGTRMARPGEYLAAGILLHAITAVELLFLLVIASMADLHPLKISVMTLLGLLAIFTQLDARSRFQEYKKIRDQLVHYGPDRRIFKSLSRSRCQRDAALAAARQLGHASICQNHFNTAGYRWYHLLPDFVRHYPSYLFSPAFLQATFFAPTYHARYPEPVETGQASTTIIVSHRCQGPIRRINCS